MAFARRYLCCTINIKPTASDCLYLAPSRRQAKQLTWRSGAYVTMWRLIRLKSILGGGLNGNGENIENHSHRILIGVFFLVLFFMFSSLTWTLLSVAKHNASWYSLLDINPTPVVCHRFLALLLVCFEPKWFRLLRWVNLIDIILHAVQAISALELI